MNEQGDVVDLQFRNRLAAFETQRNLERDGFVDFETFRALGMADPFVTPGVGIR